MAKRIKREPFDGNVEIPVLSIEDLLVCKMLYDRPKDWLDIDAVIKTRRGALDAEYIRSTMGMFDLSEADTRLARFTRLLEQ